MTAIPPLLVTGLPFAGAAVPAEALLRAGLTLGGPFLPLPPLDLAGAFVDRAIHRWHEQSFGVAGDAGEGGRATAAAGVPPASVAELESLLDRRFDRSAPWGLRSPALLQASRFWETRCPQARWLIVVRDPAVQTWSYAERTPAAGAGDPRHRTARVVHGLRTWREGSRLALGLAREHPDRVVVLDAGRFGRYGESVDRRLSELSRLPLAEISLANSFRPFLMRRRAPRWVALLSRLDPRTVANWRALSRMAIDAEPSPARRGRRVCVVAKHRFAPSESFIQEQLRRLSGEVHFVFRRDSAWHDRDCLPLLGPFGRARAALGSAFGFDFSEAQDRVLGRYLRRHRISCVLANFGALAVQVLPACRAARVPLVAHFHGADAHRERQEGDSSEYYAQLFREAAAIVAVSEPMIERLVSLGARRERIDLVPCGVEVADFPPGDPAAAPPRFLAAGRFVGKKGPLLTLLAFRRLLDSLPEARLVMLGDGELRGACIQLAAVLGMAGQVEFPGTFAHAELSAWLRSARAFVQHSLRQLDGDSEGTPVALLEASASGLPVVSTRHAGIPRAVLDTTTGLLCDEGDVAGMSAAMLALARDPELAAALGRRGREHVSERFALDRQIRRLDEIVRRAERRESSPEPQDAAAPGEYLLE